jgi:hypothetical protein
MRSEVLLALCALGWAVLAPCAIVQSETNPPAQVEPPERPDRQRPGEYPDYLFREPHPALTVETSVEFREKYLLGDWLGARSQPAAEGIKPLVLFITDPFVNAAGGQRRGFSEYDLLGLELLLDTNSSAGPAASFASASPITRARACPRTTSATTSRSSSRTWPTPTPG